MYEYEVIWILGGGPGNVIDMLRDELNKKGEDDWRLVQLTTGRLNPRGEPGHCMAVLERERRAEYSRRRYR